MSDPFDPPSPSRTRGRAAVVWGMLGLTVAFGGGCIAYGSGESVLLGFAVLFLGGTATAVVGAASPPTALTMGGALAGTVVGLGSVVAVPVLLLFARGRQLRQDGVLQFAPLVDGDDWLPPGGSVEVPEPLRDAVAAAWRHNGLTEHASVAAFARLSLELVALGAPPELLVDAARDGIDEIRHTEACFGLARAIDGRELAPGPMPAASTAGALSGSRLERLTELAVSSLVDGALHEGASARILAKLWPEVEDERVREMVRRIAADEGRHAAHGWDVVSWCLREGGEPVRRALAEAVLPTEIRSAYPTECRDGSWQRWGIVGAELEARLYAESVAQVRRQLEAWVQEAAA